MQLTDVLLHQPTCRHYKSLPLHQELLSSRSVAEPDGLRLQNLKDLLWGVADDHQLLVGITCLNNMLLGSHTPKPVTGTLFRASLLAIAKKTASSR
jgi:hypothetical protein